MAPSTDDIPRRSRLGPLLIAIAMGLSCLLAAPMVEAREVVHVVQKGQWLDVIAKRYHTTADAILERNGMKSNDLKPGMKLIIVETDEHRKWREYVEKSSGKRVKERVHHEKKAAPAPSKPAPRKKAAPKPRPVAEPKPAAAVSAPPPREIKSAKQRVAPRATEVVEAKPTPTATPAPVAPPTEAQTPPALAKDAYAKAPKRPGYVTLIRYGEKFRGQLVASNGEVVAASSERVDRLLRSLRTGKQTKINRRLLALLTKISDHFGGRTIVVVSGFRPYSPKQYTRNSRHNHGEAVDFKVTGVPTDVVFEVCRQFEDVGCGFYPNSGFVHMDVRGRKTQWTDYSRPGQPPKYAKRSASRAGSNARLPTEAAPTDAMSTESVLPAEPERRTDGRGAKRSPAPKD